MGGLIFGLTFVQSQSAFIDVTN